MATTDFDSLVRDWIDYHHRAWAAETRGIGQAPDHSDYAFWAVDELIDICGSDPDLCWATILAILKVDSTEAIMASLAAGPLEYLLVRHGNEVIDRVEARARDDAAFRRLLGGVWNHTISNDVWARIEAVRDAAW